MSKDDLRDASNSDAIMRNMAYKIPAQTMAQTHNATNPEFVIDVSPKDVMRGRVLDFRSRHSRLHSRGMDRRNLGIWFYS